MSLLPSRSALIVSTTPPFPRTYGNRNRVFQMTDFLRSLGFTIAFVLYPFDRDWKREVPPTWRMLADQFDYFTVVPNSRPLHQRAAGRHHSLDEWWDESLELTLTWLYARMSFDVVVANYVFFSKALALAPRSALRILDTHDIFTGRRELFEANGVAPEFFYTTIDQEAAAYARADAVLAIKESEADFIRSLYRGQTFCLPYFDAEVREPRDGQRTFDHDRPLRLGFIGAENSVNIVNLTRFLAIFWRYVLLYNPPVEILVAGEVCRGLEIDYPFVRRLGRVASVGDFYAGIDAALVPFAFSTGIKIKVGEALAYRVPVLATQNAFDGYRDFHRSQAEPDLHALADRVVSVAWGETPFRDLANAALKSARAAQRAQARGLGELGAWVLARSPRMIVIVDRAFWDRATFLDEAIAQSLEFLSHICRIILCCVSLEPPDLAAVHARMECVAIPDIAGLAGFLREVGAKFDVRRYVTLLVGGATQGVCAGVTAETLPLWSLAIEPEGVNTGLAFHEGLSGVRLPVAALRYRPLAAAPLPAEAGQIDLFRRPGGSAWQDLAARLVHLIAAELGYQVRVVTVPADQAASGALYAAVTQALPAKAIALVDEVFWGALLEDLYARTGSRLMLLHQDFCSPERRVHGMPSLEASIAAFLSGQAVAEPPPTAEGGWHAVWDALAAT